MYVCIYECEYVWVNESASSVIDNYEICVCFLGNYGNFGVESIT